MVTYCLASSMEAAGVLKAVSMVSLKISIPMVSTNATIANTDRVVPMVRQVLSSSFMPVYFPTRMVPPRVRPDTMLVMIFGFILSVLITNQIKKPIDRLVRHIGHVAAGNFTRDPDIEGEDEIGTVGKVVNDMSERIDTLMAERLEHEKEKGDL